MHKMETWIEAWANFGHRKRKPEFIRKAVFRRAGKELPKIENKIYLNGTNLMRIDAADEPAGFIPGSGDAVTDSAGGNLNANVAREAMEAVKPGYGEKLIA